jgi:hypothetical protein
MANNKKSLKDKGYYAIYKNRDQFSKNKIRKLERHLRAFPNDTAAAGVLASIRSGSKSPRWGYKGAEKTTWTENRVVMGVRAILRRVDRVYKTVKNPHSMVLGKQNTIYDVLQLKEVFGYRPSNGKQATAVGRGKPVRRGKKTKPQVAAAA